MLRALLLLTATSTLLACGLAPDMKPIEPADRVELPRFMGDWYVIANIPTFIEKEAYNAVENYRLADDGTIATTFTFNEGALDGPAKKYEPTGFVTEGTENAVWGMQFIWPIKAQYVIAYVDDAYSQTIVARDKRDHVWIMARTPTLDPAVQEQLIEKVRTMGYDISTLRLVPQRNR